MAPGIGIGLPPIARGSGGFMWQTYWTQLLTEEEDNLVTEADEIIEAEQNITE